MTSLSSLLRMRHVSYISCRGNQNIHFIPNNHFSENRALYEIMWKNIVGRDSPQMTIWCMRIACWITKATNTHSEYVILIAFPQQQWWHQSAPVLRYMNIDVLFQNS